FRGHVAVGHDERRPDGGRRRGDGDHDGDGLGPGFAPLAGRADDGSLERVDRRLPDDQLPESGADAPREDAQGPEGHEVEDSPARSGSSESEGLRDLTPETPSPWATHER